MPGIRATVCAQSHLLQYRTLSPADGLAGSAVYSMEQDDQGFIWIATSEGIQQYDGYRFRTYSKATHPLRSSLYRRLINVCGKIWAIAGYRDFTIDIIDPVTQQIRTFEEVWPDAPPAARIIAVGPGPGRSILIGTEEGELFQCGDELLKIANISPEIQWFDAYFPNDTTLWLAGERNWCQFRWPSVTLRKDCETIDIAKQSALHSLPEGLFMVVVDSTTRRSNLLFKRRGMLPESVYRPRPAHIGIDLSHYNSISTDRLRRVWLYNGRQIDVIDASSGLHVVTLDKQEILTKTGHEINLSSIQRVHFDRSNIAWMPTNKGILLVSITTNHFQKFLHADNISTRGMAVIDSHRVVVATYKGVYAIDPDDPSASTVLPVPPLSPVALLYEKPVLWVATHESTLIRFDLTTRQSKRYVFSHPSGRERQLTGLFCYRDKAKRLWVGTEKGIFYLDEQRDTLLEWIPAGFSARISDVHQFVESQEGLWVVAGSGLYLKSSYSDKIIQMSAFAGQNLYFLHMDRVGDFWLGTRGGGLIHWDRKANGIRRITTADGLSSNTVYSIFEDRNGLLWMSTNMGINVFDKESHTAQVFSTRNGLSDNEFNFAAWLRLPDGRILMGGIDGLVAFYPERLPLRRKREVPLQVWNLQYYDAATKNMVDVLPAFHAGGVVSLPASASNLLVEFALSDMFDPSGNRFAYMLEGVSPGWQYIRESYLRFGSLPYGSHVLRIRGFGSDGAESRRELLVTIMVERPYYIKTGFWLLMALILIGIFAALMWWRTRQLRRAKTRLEHLVEERTRHIEAQKQELEKLNHTKDRLFAIIAHELRNPVLQIQDFAEKVDFLIQKGAINRIRMLSGHLGKTTTQVREILENLLSWGKIQSGRQIHRPRQFDLQTVTAGVLKQIQPLAERKSIVLKVTEEKLLCVLADPNNLEIVLRNLLQNALKFTSLGGSISFSTQRVADKIHLKIADTGIGMEESVLRQIEAGQTPESRKGTAGERGTGLGLAVCRELIAQDNGQILIESKLQIGTTVSVIIPSTESVQVKDIPTQYANTPFSDR